MIDPQKQKLQMFGKILVICNDYNLIFCIKRGKKKKTII